MATLSREQQRKKNERALRRRQEQQAARFEQAVDGKTGERYDIQVLPKSGTKVKNAAPVVRENLKILREPEPTTVMEKKVAHRVRYAQMHTHKELAAIAIAAGANTTQAAAKAGVSRRQIRKYMEDADFRERIHELQETLGGRIRGRVIKEIGRRTSPKMIKKMELLDLLRVGDRFGLGRGNASVVNINNEVTNYEANFNALFHAEDPKRLSDPEEEGADFPEFEPTSVALSGGDSPIDG